MEGIPFFFSVHSEGLSYSKQLKDKNKQKTKTKTKQQKTNTKKKLETIKQKPKKGIFSTDL